MSDSPDLSDPDGTGTGRRPVVLAARGALILLAVGIVVFGLGHVAYKAFAPDSTPSSQAERPELSEDADSTGGPPTASIGPEPGTDLATYTTDRMAALDEATGERVAIISLAAYVTEDAAEDLFADTEVGVLWVAVPGNEPTTTSDIGRFRAQLTAEADEQLPALRELLPTVDDPEFADFYAAEIERYESILASADTPDVVFGAVVRADAGKLQSLAAHESVRLVDVGASGALAPDAVLRALRPEETTTAGTPVIRPHL